jgi:hypothetical protein
MKITENRLRSIIRSIIKEASGTENESLSIVCRYGIHGGVLPRWVLIKTNHPGYESRDDDKIVNNAEELAKVTGIHQENANEIFDELVNIQKSPEVEGIIEFANSKKQMYHVYFKGRPTLGNSNVDWGKYMVSTGKKPTRTDMYNMYD